RALTTDPKVLLLDELSMGLAPIVVEELYEIVGRIAAEDVSILIVEQFAHEVLDVAETAAIMLHGQIQLTGRPHQIAEELDAACLGLGQQNWGAPSPRRWGRYLWNGRKKPCSWSP